MPITVCTLFEKDYHRGLAVLVNSLARNGFSGVVVAGYRGPIPAWAAGARVLPGPARGERVALQVTPDAQIQFWPLTTDAHFTNFKADFMLSVLDEPTIDGDGIFYLDPDIVLATRWSFMEEWLSCGIALCEDVNSPLMANHPRRIGWRRHFGERGIRLNHCTDQYVNGGCVGVRRGDRDFILTWKTMCDAVADATGGNTTAKVGGGTAPVSKGFASCFDCSDQDALNAAMEVHFDRTYSVLPRSAMGFEAGTLILPHAIGASKPWSRRYLLEALAARPPRAVDKAYWAQVRGPAVQAVSGTEALLTRAGLKVASAIGRAWRRS